jgi:hypothetical protein
MRARAGADVLFIRPCRAEEKWWVTAPVDAAPVDTAPVDTARAGMTLKLRRIGAKIRKLIHLLLQRVPKPADVR